jgi:hypothetical protein
VEEIWSGLDLAPVVEVHGSEIVAHDVWFSADRTYEAGQRYVFALDIQNGRLRDHACTATLAWIDELDRFRPVAVRGPAGARIPDATTTEPILAGAALGGGAALTGVVALGAVTILLRRRRSLAE